MFANVRNANLRTPRTGEGDVFDGDVNLPSETTSSPTTPVLEYQRVEPVIRQESDRRRRAVVGGWVTFVLFMAFVAGAASQSDFPESQHRRDLDNWLQVELQRRVYERAMRRNASLGQPPAPPAPVTVRRWASDPMMIVYLALALLALFSNRLVRRAATIVRPPLLTPTRIWRAMLTLASLNLLLAILCMSTDAWLIFTPDLLFAGWFLIALILTELITRWLTKASLPTLLQKISLASPPRPNHVKLR